MMPWGWSLRIVGPKAGIPTARLLKLSELDITTRQRRNPTASISCDCHDVTLVESLGHVGACHAKVLRSAAMFAILATAMHCFNGSSGSW
jgi:hypothetical protein